MVGTIQDVHNLFTTNVSLSSDMSCDELLVLNTILIHLADPF